MACHMGTRLEGEELHLIHILQFTCDSTPYAIMTFVFIPNSKQITVYKC